MKERNWGDMGRTLIFLTGEALVESVESLRGRAQVKSRAMELGVVSLNRRQNRVYKNDFFKDT